MNKKLCYCGAEVIEEKSLSLNCHECKSNFHLECVKSGKPSMLHGDSYFDFTCSKCSGDGNEIVERSKLSWMTVVSLALYNLQLNGNNGKQGYFRWKEHICAFIDKHWSLLLPYKKKTSLWYGTIAGALSSGCPKYFTSGLNDLHEPGWWRLTDKSSPFCKPADIVRKGKKPEVHQAPSVKLEGLRTRNKKSSIAAAIELKEKRLQTFTSKQAKKEEPTEASVILKTKIKSEPKDTSSDINNSNVKIKEEPLDTSYLDSTNSLLSTSSTSDQDLLTNQDLLAQDQLPDFLLQDDEIAENDNDEDSDIEIDPGGISSGDVSLLDSQLSLDDILSTIPDHCGYGSTNNIPDKTVINPIKKESVDDNDDGDVDDDNNDDIEEMEEDEEDDNDDMISQSDESRIRDELDSEGEENESRVPKEKRQRRIKIETKIIPPKLPQYKPMSLYDEKVLLQRLRQAAESHQLSPEVTRFKQKLTIRQLKRERGLPVFDLDNEISKRSKYFKDENGQPVPYTRFPHEDLRILDRFQTSHGISRHLEPDRPCFINRLVGTEDNQLQSIRSPYTTRILKPFIRRDYESRPLKMRLLEEIKAYPHRNNKDWKASKPPPIDYCYVRPEHIPSVNTLSQQFFWPHIDLSECLHYPDFSCVVLYRKIVIGFAFMVPDVKYNEAYISFIFTHPEWRRAGIAKFMVYHLIQTCMGKDVTLHVSATNPAMLLYQKFGFKPEEFLLDFYDKYYPADSKDCKHAFFLRLRR